MKREADSPGSEILLVPHPIPVEPFMPAPSASIVPAETSAKPLSRSLDRKNYVSSTVLMERDIRHRIAQKLLMTDDPRDYSQLMVDLAKQWLEENPAY